MSNNYRSQISARKRIYFFLCQNKENQYINDQAKKEEALGIKSQCYWTDEEKVVSER